MTIQIKALTMDFSHLLAFMLLLNTDPMFQLAKENIVTERGRV